MYGARHAPVLSKPPTPFKAINLHASSTIIHFWQSVVTVWCMQGHASNMATCQTCARALVLSARHTTLGGSLCGKQKNIDSPGVHISAAKKTEATCRALATAQISRGHVSNCAIFASMHSASHN